MRPQRRKETKEDAKKTDSACGAGIDRFTRSDCRPDSCLDLPFHSSLRLPLFLCAFAVAFNSPRMNTLRFFANNPLALKPNLADDPVWNR
jgi:hypothetical protein